MVEESYMKICVIGAGSSGLAAIKACREAKLNVVCFEKSDYFGGLWHFHSDDSDGRPSVMKSTVINTSKEMSAFSDFPPPEKFANFMHNSSMMEYLKLYAEKFGLSKYIIYNHEVSSVEMADDYDTTGKWKVTATNLTNNISVSDVYDGVMVCAGHHIYPYIPQFPGMEEFEGTVSHSHSLKSSDGYAGKSVIVVGIGNSGVDAAVEISKVSKELYLSSRRGSWIFSRLGPNGIPYDIFLQKRFFEFLRRWDPFHLTDWVVECILNWKFDHFRYGLKPRHRVLSAHVTINDALPNCILSGIVTVKQNIKKFTKNGVIFEDEEEISKVDAAVLATGYEIKFPFISEKILQVKGNNVNLYKFVFPSHIKHPTLAFIALTQPLGAMFPIAEGQSRWFVQLMNKNVTLPSQLDMEKEIAGRLKENTDRFVPSPRHTIQVQWIPYMDDICSEFGAKPNLWKLAFTRPRLYIACVFGPCTPYQYRLYGPHQWRGAAEAILSAWNRIESPLKSCKRI